MPVLNPNSKRKGANPNRTDAVRYSEALYNVTYNAEYCLRLKVERTKAEETFLREVLSICKKHGRYTE